MPDVCARETGGRQRVKRRVVLAAVMTTLVMSVTAPAGAGRALAQAAVQAPVPVQAPVAVRSRLMVIPFEDTTREPRVYWLGEGSAVVLTDDLAALGAAPITRDDRLRAFERLRVPAVAKLSYATTIRLGQIVGASDVIVGSFEIQGEELTVRSRAIRLDSGRMTPEIVERGPLPEVFAIYGRVARRLVPESRVTPEEMEQGHPPVAAFELYVKGLIAEAPAARETFLMQALKVSPTFQRARIALWDAYTDQSQHQQAFVAARQVPPAHRLGRQARFLAAVSLINLARYSEAYDVLADLNRAAADPALLNDLGVVQLRRPAGAPGNRAVTYFSQAAQLEPSDADLFFNLGYASWIERDMVGAVTGLREAVRRNPADAEAHYILGTALQATGGTAEGAREKELATRLSSVFGEWETKQPGNPVPRGLERLKTEVDVPAALRVDSIIDAAGQREQREVAAIHLEAGRRLYQAERDVEAVAELRRAVYLAPYQSEAHLLLGRLYLRAGRVAEATDALKISVWSEDTVAARVALAEAYIAAKDAVNARAELAAILRRDAANPDARRLVDSLP